MTKALEDLLNAREEHNNNIAQALEQPILDLIIGVGQSDPELWDHIGYYIRKDPNYNQKGIESSKAAEICPEDKKLYVNPEESEIVKWIYATFLKTNSIRRTTIQLNARGVKTRKGDLWPKTTIHRLLSSPTYVGKIWYGKRKTDPVSGKLIAQDKKTWTIVEGEHDAIISHDIFEKAQNLLSQNKGKPTKSGRTYILSGIILG